MSVNENVGGRIDSSIDSELSLHRPLSARSPSSPMYSAAFLVTLPRWVKQLRLRLPLSPLVLGDFVVVAGAVF